MSVTESTSTEDIYIASAQTLGCTPRPAASCSTVDTLGQCLTDPTDEQPTDHEISREFLHAVRIEAVKP